ncbi:unnamed protein product [Mycena citricolor]|uniref:Peptidase M43 pregnancy-associated plasma-A domain-containing protein n=1 Tax=Mycena citricolor TaxID=2018698 RepID=A0AAD2K248_9AGAR|nr:unnamed protein product [Mycena citricolor]
MISQYSFTKIALFFGLLGAVAESNPLDFTADPAISLTNNTVRNIRCGTEVLDRLRLMAVEDQFLLDQQAAPDFQDTGVLNINVYWHIIRQDKTTAGGNLSPDQVRAQMDVLNSDFGGAINWTLASAEWVTNAAWFNNAAPGTSEQSEMKMALKKGGMRDLNVYTVGFNSGQAQYLLGYASFPYAFKSNPTDDGIVIRFTTLPGGNEPYANLGRTATHEAGHWAGLYHTFQGGCSSPGDYVTDTPPEASGASGCPKDRKSCPGKDASVDPIHNFMDYSDDSCMTQFTPEQVKRMFAQLSTYRSIRSTV